MRLIQVDQEVPIASRIGQHALELLDKRLSPHGVGPAEQLFGLLPAQAQAVQGGADRFAAAGAAEPLAHPGGQPLEGPAGCRPSAGYGRGCGGALGLADDLAEAGLSAAAKGGGRPPVRR